MLATGMGAAPAAGFAPRSREASGHRRKPPPAAASFPQSDADCASLSAWGTTTPVRGTRWNGRRHHAFVQRPTRRDEAMSRTGVERARGEGWPTTYKRGPEPKIADERSATGRAGSGSICPRRDLAQWLRLDTSRLAALRCPSASPTPQGGRALKRGREPRHGEPLSRMGEGQG